MRGREEIRLSLAQRVLLAVEARLHNLQGIALGLEHGTLFIQGSGGLGEAFCDGIEFLLGGQLSFFGLGDVAQSFAVLVLEFVQALLIELNAAFVTVDLSLEFEPVLLGQIDLVFQLGQPAAELNDFIFNAENTFGADLGFCAQFFDASLALGDFTLENIKLMP